MSIFATCVMNLLEMDEVIMFILLNLPQKSKSRVQRILSTILRERRIWIYIYFDLMRRKLHYYWERRREREKSRNYYERLGIILRTLRVGLKVTVLIFYV